MPSPEAVTAALKRLSGAEKFLGRREIKELPSILWEDELPEKIVQGFYNNGNGLLVATNKRLIFIDKGMFSLRVEDFPYDKISSIQYKTSLLLGAINIYASGNNAEITQVIKDQVRPFAEYVRARITGTADHASYKPSDTSGGGEDVFALLEKLGNLRDQGVITPDDFEAKKKELLSRI